MLYYYYYYFTNTRNTTTTTDTAATTTTTGCQYFFSDNPETTQCKAKCMGAYRYRITAEYSDAATEAQENCIDGCDIGKYCRGVVVCV